MNIATLKVRIGADIRELEQAMSRAQRAVQDTSRRLTELGRTMSMRVTTPLLGLGAAAFKLGSDFETSMSKIEGLVGISRDQVDAWGDDIRRIARDSGRSLNEMGEAMFFVTSAGNRGAEAIELLETSAKAAAAGLGETKTVAHLLSSAIAAYGSENLSASKAADILVASVREGKAEASELAQSMGHVLPIASEMGVSFDQVGASIAAMTRTGTDAGTASMQLRQILSAIIRPTKQAEEALEDMGTSASGLRRQIREEGLISVLGFLRQQMSENENAMSQVFPNIRALSGALDIMGANADSNAQIFENLTDATGSLDNAYDAVNRTARQELNRTIESLKQTVEMFYDSLVDLLIPAMQSIRERLDTVREAFDGLERGTQMMIVTVGTLAAALGPLLLILGKVGAIIAALNIKIIAVIAAISGIALGLEYVRRNMSAFAAWFSDMWDRTVNDMIYNVQLALRALNMFAKVLDPAGLGLDPVIASLEGLKREIPDRSDGYGFQGFGEFIGDVSSDMMDILARLTERLFGVSETVEEVSEKGVEAFRDFGAEIDRASLGVANLNTGLINMSRSLETVNTQQAGIPEHLRGAYRAAQDALNEQNAELLYAQDLAHTFTDSFGRGMANVVVQAESLTDALRSIGRLLASSAIQMGIRMLLTGGTGGGGSITGGLLGRVFSVNDAMITSRGDVVKFHPNDNILAMQDFSGLGGGIDASTLTKALNNLSWVIDGKDIRISNERAGRSFR